MEYPLNTNPVSYLTTLFRTQEDKKSEEAPNPAMLEIQESLQRVDEEKISIADKRNQFAPILEKINNYCLTLVAEHKLTSNNEHKLNIFAEFFSEFQQYINELHDDLRPMFNVKVADVISKKLKNMLINGGYRQYGFKIREDILSKGDLIEVAKYYSDLFSKLAENPFLNNENDRVGANYDKYLAEVLVYLKEYLSDIQFSVLVANLCEYLKFNTYEYSNVVSRLCQLIDDLSPAQVATVLEIMCSRFSYEKQFSGVFTRGLLNFLTHLKNYREADGHDLEFHLDGKKLLLKQLERINTGFHSNTQEYKEKVDTAKEACTILIKFFHHFNRVEQDEILNEMLEFEDYHPDEKLYEKLNDTQRKFVARHNIRWLEEAYDFQDLKLCENRLGNMAIFKNDFDPELISALIEKYLSFQEYLLSETDMNLAVARLSYLVTVASELQSNEILLAFAKLLKLRQDTVVIHDYEQIARDAIINNLHAISKENLPIVLEMLFDYLNARLHKVFPISPMQDLARLIPDKTYWKKIIDTALAFPAELFEKHILDLSLLAKVISASQNDSFIKKLCGLMDRNISDSFFALASIVDADTLIIDTELLLNQSICSYVDRNINSSDLPNELFDRIAKISRQMTMYNPADYATNVILNTLNVLGEANSSPNKSLIYALEMRLSYVFQGDKFNQAICDRAKLIYINSAGAHTTLFQKIYKSAASEKGIRHNVDLIKFYITTSLINPVLCMDIAELTGLNPLNAQEVKAIYEFMASMKVSITSTNKFQDLFAHFLPMLDNRNRIRIVNSLPNLPGDHGIHKKLLFLYARALNKQTLQDNFHQSIPNRAMNKEFLYDPSRSTFFSRRKNDDVSALIIPYGRKSVRL